MKHTLNSVHIDVSRLLDSALSPKDLKMKHLRKNILCISKFNESSCKVKVILL